MKKFKLINILLVALMIVNILAPNVSAFAAERSNSKGLEKVGTASVSATFFEDLNGNYTQDPDEAGVPGVIVKLYDASTLKVVETQETDASGKYNFTSLPAGRYYLNVKAPEGYKLFTQGSLGFGPDGNSGYFTISEGQVFTEGWGGLYPTTAMVSGSIFGDENKNGAQDGSEKGIPGIELGLYLSGSSTPLQTTKSDATGKYIFKKITTGQTYEVRTISVPPKYQVIKNSNFDNTGKSIPLFLNSGDNRQNINLALYENVPVTGLTVTPEKLYEEVGNKGKITANVLPSNASNKEILYSSEDSSIIGVDSVGNWVAKAAGTTRIKVSSASNPEQFVYIDVTIVETKNSSINGIISKSDGMGFSSISVSLIEVGTDKVVGSTTTSQTGSYSFTGLKKGNYYVSVTIPKDYEVKNGNGYFDTTGKTGYLATDGSSVLSGINLQLKEKDVFASSVTVTPSKIDAITGDTGNITTTFEPANTNHKKVTYTVGNLGIISVDPVTGIWTAKNPGTTSITVTAEGGASKTIDVIVRSKANSHIGGKIVDSNNVGVANARLTLYRWNGEIVGTQTTTSDGLYDFGGSSAMDYYVKLEVPDGYKFISSRYFFQGQTGYLKVDGTQNISDVNAIVDIANPKSSAISGKITDLSNGNIGMSQVKVSLFYASTGESVSTVTSADGSYSFDALKAGYYYLKLTSPTGYELGSSEKFYQDLTTAYIYVDGKSKAIDYNAALKKKIPENQSSLSGKINLLNVGGYGNVALDLYSASGIKQTTAYTDASGAYSFANLEKGTYYIKLNIPAGKEIFYSSGFGGDGVSGFYEITGSNTIGGIDATLRDKDVPVTGITVEPKELNQVVGDTGKLNVTFTPSNATNQTLTYTSANPEIMTVDKAGNWKAVGPGETTITVKTANGLTAEVQVTVKQKEKSSLAGTVKDKTSGLGYSGLTVILYDITGKPIGQTVTSSTGSYLFDSLVQGTYYLKLSIPAGKEITTPSSFGGDGVSGFYDVTGVNSITGIDATLKDKEVPVENLTVEPKELNQIVGDTGKLNVTITPSNATDKTLTYTSANPEIMTVDKDGNWVAVAPGKTTITVKTANGLTAEVQVTVKAKEIPVESLTVEPKELNQIVGDTGKLNVTITPNNATDQSLTFTSANPEIMTVDKDGNWKAVAPGKTTITVKTANGLTAEVQVTVTPQEKSSLSGTVKDKVSGIGYSGLTIVLYSFDGKPIGQTVTGVSGSYAFNNLPKGTYYLKLTIPSGKEIAIPSSFGGDGVSSFYDLTGANSVTGIDATLKDKEVPVTGITVEPKELNQTVGDKGKLNVTITPSNATDKSLTYTSANPEIMTVDKDGNWEAVAPGKTMITVKTANGLTAEVQVTVKAKEISVESLTVEPKELNQIVGDTGKLNVTITPSNATDKTLTYTSANPEIMTVDKDGNWKAVAPGKTTITVKTANGLTAEVQVTVNPQEKSSLSGTVKDKVSGIGYSGLTVILYSIDGKPIGQTVTGVSGSYVFSNLPKGTYYLKLMVPTGKEITIPSSFGSDGVSSFYDLTGTNSITEIDATLKDKDIPVEGITVEPKELNQIVGDIGKLNVTITPSNATDKTLTYTSANPEIMTVDNDGNWKAVAPGKTTITVKAANGLTTEVQVTVKAKDIPVESVTVEPKELNQVVGDAGKLNVTITPSNATDKTLTYTSANPEIMTVDKDGNWKAVAPGKTTITVKAANGLTTEVQVTVKAKDIPVESVTVEPKELNQIVGDAGKLNVTISPNNATDQSLTFTSANPEIMTVDKDGNWKAVAPGKTTITVKAANGLTAEVQVTVNPQEKSSLSGTIKDKSSGLGYSGLTVTLYSSDGKALGQTVTGISGKYVFNNLPKGTYYLKLNIPDGKEIAVPSSFSEDGVSNFYDLTGTDSITGIDAMLKDKSIPVESLTVKPKELNQIVGDTGKLNVTITPSNATDKSLTYASADPEIMTIDQAGNWVAKAPGKTTITVKAANGITAYVQVTVKAKDVPVESITVEPKELNQIVGDTGKLNVTTTPSNATDKTLTYTSANPEIMTIDKDGNWKAVAPGKTTITVKTANGLTAEVQVTVKAKDIPVESITVEPKELNQIVGDTGKLNVTITPSNATDKSLTYTSANPEIMTVDKDGNWIAKSVGKTTLIVTTKNGLMSFVQVTVKAKDVPVENITVEPKELNQIVGDTGKLNVTISPSNATDKTLTYTSADPEIMTIDQSGNWVAKAPGKTTITVRTSNGITAYVQVTVKAKDVPVESLTVEPKELNQIVGDTGKLNVSISPSNATDKTLTYTSADPEIMTIDQSGNWVAKAPGKTTITVRTSNGITATVQVTVTKKVSQGVGVTFYDYPRSLGYFVEKGTGTATNFDDDYNNEEPYPGLGTDYYKVKKVGFVTVKETGRYTFSVETDDAGTVYLDDEKIIDHDNVIGGALSNFRYLQAGQTIKITTEHFNKEAPVSYFHLKWQTPSNPYSPASIPDADIVMDAK
ncbi:Ig-like domain-containing protein [Listeria aquatica]|uniref:Ig-like domain-containing protein n=1 Tax=Listeria aquatica TaxID=1494960 RepID=UPI003F6E8DD3